MRDDAGPRRVVLVGGSAQPRTVRTLVAAGCEAWGMNAVLTPFDAPDGRPGRPIPASRWFQIHPPWSCDAGERAWAEICPIPLYAIQHYPEWPSSVAYPLDAVMTIRGAAAAGCASTMAWALALAIHEGVDEFALVGVRLQLGTMRERSIERANLAWWVGLATGLRMRVSVDPDGHPAASPGGYRYGWDYAEERQAVAAWCRQTQALGRIDGP